ncbi:CocE/NonD family hydrolase [Streptomyces sp. NPDC051018]|uniref:CocE/NonD family hydrolase n=1 Tax=Streptomyces sp. NPDC051018 TaxID=3365639 RepID=UPI00378DB90F
MRHRPSVPPVPPVLHETSHEDIRIPLLDGTRLYARLWRPLTDAPVPVLLEYAPDRLTDATAPRDAQRHPWYAAHGYASVRVDARGYGNSEGVPADPSVPLRLPGPGDEDKAATGTGGPETTGADGLETTGAGVPEAPANGPDVLTDGAEVIDWLAGQPWCTGRVGMFGLGRGATWALRLAALAPGPLDAVVTVGAAGAPYDDYDNYDNGASYPGGSPSADAMQSRSAALLSALCRPPDPAYAGDGWRELWLRRLESVEPPLHRLLAHPLRDDHWTRGEPLSSLRAAVLAVGGWHEPYRDTVFALLDALPADRVRGLIGPWALQYPDHGRPGPAIGFLRETLAWWDRHLRDEANGVMDGPLLRAWIEAPGTGGGGRGGSRTGRDGPGADGRGSPGRDGPAGPGPGEDGPGPVPGKGGPGPGEGSPGGYWVAENVWPSPALRTVSYALQGPPGIVDSPQQTGVDAGRWLPAGGRGADLPPDQRAEDARSACFEFPVEGAAVEILGRPRVTLRLRLDVPYGQVIARLCDIAPDGSSALVTRGVLNLAARHGTERADAWPPGTAGEVAFALDGAGHRFPPGHRVRLALSSAYWPWVWPQPGAAGFVLDPGGSRLELPVRTDTAYDPVRGPAYDPAFGPPERTEPLGVSTPATLTAPGERRPERLVVRDVGAGEWRVEADPETRDTGGRRLFPDGLELVEEAREIRTIREDDPRSARAESTRTVRLHRPDLAWDVTVETRSVLTRDPAEPGAAPARGSGSGAGAASTQGPRSGTAPGSGTGPAPAQGSAPVPPPGFIAEDEVICRHGGEVVFHRTWRRRLPVHPGDTSARSEIAP